MPRERRIMRRKKIKQSGRRFYYPYYRHSFTSIDVAMPRPPGCPGTSAGRPRWQGRRLDLNLPADQVSQRPTHHP